MSTTTAILGLVKNGDEDNARTALQTNLPANMDKLDAVLAGTDAYKIPAAALAQAYMVLIGAPVVVAAGGVASIDILNIPQTYRNLRLVMSGLLTGAAAGVTVRLNDVATDSYYSQLMEGYAATVVGSESLAQNYGKIGSMAGDGSYASIIDVLFPNYIAATYRRWTSQYGYAMDVGTGNIHVGSLVGFLNGAVPISKITIFGSFAAGTVVSLYGCP